MRRTLLLGLGALVALLLLIQLIPVARTNPPVTADMPASPELHAVLKQSCYDCHSNETEWPWFTTIAPMSWLAVRDTNEGRRRLNFSQWDQVSAEQQARVARESWGQVAEGEMPPFIYVLPHPNARLTDAGKAILQQWANGAAAPAAGSNSGTPISEQEREGDLD